MILNLPTENHHSPNWKDGTICFEMKMQNKKKTKQINCYEKNSMHNEPSKGISPHLGIIKLQR